MMRFFLGMAIAATATVFFGFAPTYYLKSFTHTAVYPTGLPVSPTLPALVHVHALAFTAWILLFLVQTTLIAADRPHLHRRLGIAGAGLAPFMVVVGVMTAVKGARDGWNPGGPYPDSLAFLIVGLVDVVIFELHKRLMLLATVGGLMWPAITRMPYVAGRPILMFGLLGALVLASAVRDVRLRSPVRLVSVWGGLLILAAFPLRMAIGLTDGWHTLAAWLVR
jgi:hypothetical protein